MQFLGQTVLGVVFDMDGLLLDTERLSLRAWQAGAAEQGVVVPEEIFLRMVGHREADCVAILEAEYGARLDGVAVALAARGHYAALLAKGVPVMRGARELLTFLREEEIPLAVATSTHWEVARGKLAAAGLLGFFQTVTGGDQVARGKPAPDIYLAAVASLGLRGEYCVAFEDSSPGALAAAAAGLRTVLVPDLTRPTAEAVALACRVAQSLEEAREWFAVVEE